MAGGENKAAPSSVEAAMGRAAAMGEAGGGGQAAPGDGRVAGENLAAVGDVGGGPETMASVSEDAAEPDVGGGRIDSGDDATSGGGRATGSGGGATGTPSTPTVEELLAAAEQASDGQRVEASSETMTVGHAVATPILRATVVEPRSGDSGIGASHPVPFEAGDFLDSVGPRDILDALGLNSDIAAVLRDTRTPEDRVFI